MLPGLRIRKLEKNIDKRGMFQEILRSDWKELLEEDIILQSAVSLSHSGIVRAWHRHIKGQIDYLVVFQGTVKVCIFDDSQGALKRDRFEELIVSDKEPTIIRIPGGYWHGTKNIGENDSLIIYFMTKLYDYNCPDEERMSWESRDIIDPRTNKYYEW